MPHWRRELSGASPRCCPWDGGFRVHSGDRLCPGASARGLPAACAGGSHSHSPEACGVSGAQSEVSLCSAPWVLPLSPTCGVGVPDPRCACPGHSAPAARVLSLLRHDSEGSRPELSAHRIPAPATIARRCPVLPREAWVGRAPPREAASLQARSAHGPGRKGPSPRRCQRRALRVAAAEQAAGSRPTA